MDKPEIEKKLAAVFDEVFENHGATITAATTAQDIEEWDSLTNIELIVAVEKSFGIRFKSSDIQSLQNVGDLIQIIYTKTNS